MTRNVLSEANQYLNIKIAAVATKNPDSSVVSKRTGHFTKKQFLFE